MQLSPKLFVGVAIAAVAAAIVLVMTSGPALLEGVPTAGDQAPEISPLGVSVDDIRTLELTESGAILELVLTVNNPNPKSAILTLVKYQLFESEQRIAAGQIGVRAEGMVDASNYYTVLSDRSVTLRDKIILENSGGAPEFWEALRQDAVSWQVTGEAFFNLSSMTAGQENELTFQGTVN